METACNGVSSQDESEEVLGSVTHSQDSDGGIQLRTSARVSKKLRLDSLLTQAQTAGTTSMTLSHEKKDTSKEEERKGDGGCSSGLDVKPRSRRAPELWTPEDKNAFFEALNEYGKDFEAIQNHITLKAKKRGELVTKNKDQARQFYYRMWHKISKHIRFPPEVKKATQELYGLINFGELRKKIGFVTEKNALKLNELVYSGSTQIRIRGKTWRIKTPVCKALRKLNFIEECSEELRLPTRVTVELRPRHNEDWVRVQSQAQNPRVRTILPLHRRLECLLQYLNNRWKPLHIKQRNIALSEAGMNNEKVGEENDSDSEWVLHVGPKPGTHITEPSVRLSEMTTSSKISLLAHEEKFGAAAASVASMLRELQKNCGKSKSSLKRQRTESSSDKTPHLKISEEIAVINQNNNIVNPELRKEPGAYVTDFTAGLLLSPRAENGVHHVENGNVLLQSPVVCNNVSGNLSPVVNVGSGSDSSSPEKKEEPSTETDPPSALPSQQLTNTKCNSTTASVVERATAGWSLPTAGSVRIGDLYLMFGSDAKVNLDYWWQLEEHKTDAAVVPAVETATSPTSTSSSSASSDNSSTTSGAAQSNSLTLALKKLLSIAKLNYAKTKVHCPCGHECGVETTKQGTTRSRPPPKPKAAAEHVPEKINGESTNRIMPVTMDGVFRRPLIAPLPMIHKKPSTETFAAQLDKFRPRYCNRRGRSVRSKPVVVQRILPLLPKTQKPNIYTMVPVAGQNHTFTPIAPAPPSLRPITQYRIQQIQPVKPLVTEVQRITKRDTDNTSTSKNNNNNATVVEENNTEEEKNSAEEKEAEQAAVSPTNFSSLLDDLSLPGSVISRISTPTPSFVGLLTNSDTLQTPSTPSTSPTRILEEEKNQWLNAEVGDFSLSSFLNNLDAIQLKASTLETASEDACLPDVDAQLHCLMSENCTDYTSRIADLSAQIAAGLPTDNK